MPRIRSKPTNPFLNAVLRRAGYGPGQIKDAFRERNFSYKRFLRLADCVDGDLDAAAYLEYAERFNIPVDVLLRGLAGRLTDEELREWGLSQAS
jgi:hypothetical protein